MQSRQWLLIGWLSLIPAVAWGDEPRPVQVEVSDASLRAVLQQLAQQAGIQLVLSERVQGTLTASLPRQPPLVQLQQLAEVHGWHVWMSSPRLAWLGPPEELLGQWRQADSLSVLREQRLPLVSRSWSLRHVSAEEVAGRLRPGAAANAGMTSAAWLGPRGRVDVDGRRNRLWVQDHAERLAQLATFIAWLDQPTAQVLVETRLVAVSRSHAASLGVSWQLAQGRVAAAVPLAVSTPDAATLRYGLLRAVGLSLDAQLSALEARGEGEVMARPSVLTQSQQMARISSGQQIPYQETTQSGATATRFVHAELSLEVTPRITEAGDIHLQLGLSQDSPGELQSNGARAIETNRLNTQVTLQPDETLVLGGIFRDQSANSVSAVPFLGKLPVIGRLFRRDVLREDQQELLVFVTPRLVLNNDMGAAPQTLHEADLAPAERHPESLPGGPDGGRQNDHRSTTG